MVLNTDQYVEKFCLALGIEQKRLLNGSNKVNFTYRQYFSFFGNVYLKFSKSELARKLKKDHTTIIYHIQRIQGFLDIDDGMTNDAINKLKASFFDGVEDFSTIIANQKYENLTHNHNIIKKQNIEYKRLLTTARKRITDLEKKLTTWQK